MQLDKWNTHQYKSGIIEKLDKMNETQLRQIFDYVKSVVWNKFANFKAVFEV